MATKQAPATAKPNSKFSENRKKRLERTLKKQPNNEQVKLALTETRSWARKKPNTPYWSHTMIKEAQLFKEFTGKMDLTIFSNIESASSNARLHMHSDPSNKAPEGKVLFTLAARAHSKGTLVWG